MPRSDAPAGALTTPPPGSTSARTPSSRPFSDTNPASGPQPASKSNPQDV